ncbi:hypothetical protein ACNOYE_27265 [Nannocystaceae bacterium ST9]
MTPRVAWLALVLALPMACARDEYSFEVETEHVRIARTFDAPLCAGTIRAIDRDAARIAEQLDAEELAPMDVVLGIEAVLDHCPEGSAGCAQPGQRVWSDIGSVGHELVHAFAGEAPSGYQAFFDEGLAEALGGGTLDFHRLEVEIQEVSILDMVMTADLGSEGYRVAGHFVAWLIDRWGVSVFLDFRESLTDTTTLAAIDEIFQGFYGISLADADSMWRSTAPSNYTLGENGCSGWSEPWIDETRWSGSVMVDCDDVDTQGPLGWGTAVEAGMVRSVLVDVLTPGHYRISVSATRSGIVELDSVACGCWTSEHGRERFEVGEDPRTYEADLQACRYEVSFVVSGVEAGSVDVELELVEADPW